MALTSICIQELTTVKTTNQDLVGRNWSFEIHELTGDGSDTAIDITTEIKQPIFASHFSVDGTAPYAGVVNGSLIPVAGVLTINTSAAIASGKKVRLKIEGLA